MRYSNKLGKKLLQRSQGTMAPVRDDTPYTSLLRLGKGGELRARPL
jgi:hypothetical protein